jgi:hypothetical protein
MRSIAVLTLLLTTPALAGTCPDPSASPPDSSFDAERAWMHEPGWFTPLDDPRVVPARGETYDRDDPLMTVTVGDQTRAYPIEAMAYHHVANDVIGDTPIAVTY